VLAAAGHRALRAWSRLRGRPDRVAAWLSDEARERPL
jgi:hypothetical protein